VATPTARLAFIKSRRFIFFLSAGL